MSLSDVYAQNPRQQSAFAVVHAKSEDAAIVLALKKADADYSPEGGVAMRFELKR